MAESVAVFLHSGCLNFFEGGGFRLQPSSPLLLEQIGSGQVEWVNQISACIDYIVQSPRPPPFFFWLTRNIMNTQLQGPCQAAQPACTHCHQRKTVCLFFPCLRYYLPEPCGCSLSQAAISPARSQKLPLWGGLCGGGVGRGRGGSVPLGTGVGQKRQVRRSGVVSTDHSENSSEK